jgi:DNA-binding GntR family transcriptional regulator
MAILENRYSEGERLPTEAELSRAHRVSRQTVRRAYQDLVADGIVHRIPGKGTFPASGGRYLRSFGSIDELLSLSLDTELQIVSPLAIVVRPEIAELLGLEFDDVAEVTFFRLHQNLPFCFTTVALTPAIGERLLSVESLTRAGARSRATILGLLDTMLEQPVTGAKQSVTAVAAPAEIAGHIDCAPGAPVLCIERLYFSLDGRPAEHAVNYFNPSRYSYRLRLQRTSK